MTDDGPSDPDAEEVAWERDREVEASYWACEEEEAKQIAYDDEQSRANEEEEHRVAWCEEQEL